LAYLAGFAVAYVILRRMSRRGVLRLPVADIGDLLGWLVLGVVAGGGAGWWFFYGRLAFHSSGPGQK
jgi:prolipoprotein diacylglyceryltransferase